MPPARPGDFDVTRIARITGLDRTGVEVACAIRPTGHVLQVANGKGITFAQAAARAWSEAAELWAAEQVDPWSLRWETWEGLQRRGVPALHPLGLGSAGAPLEGVRWTPGLRLAWSQAHDVLADRPVWVPSQALHCLREGDWPLGPQLVAWTTNGMGAHRRRDAAVRHALLEAMERDQLARTLPQGWTAAAVRRRKVTLEGAGASGRLAARLAQRGFEAHLFDLTPTRSLGLPVAGALLFDAEAGPVPLTAGYACRPRPEEALEAALLEAAQSRLTDVHGAREDVEPMDPGAAVLLRQLCASARPRRSVSQMPAVRGSAGLTSLLGALRRAGHRTIGVAELSPPRSPLHVVKVIVPRFRVSGLL